MRVEGGWVHCERRWVMICGSHAVQIWAQQPTSEWKLYKFDMHVQCDELSPIPNLASKSNKERKSLILRLPQILSTYRASYWKFTVQDKSQCHVPLGNTTDDIISCTINFAICHSLQDGALCSGEDSSICQEVELTNGTVYYDMGAYDPTHSYTVLGRSMLALF